MEELEALRRKIKSIYIFTYAMIIIICIIASFEYHLASIYFLVISSLFVNESLSRSSIRRQYARKYKNYFVLKCLKEYFTDIKYEPDQGMPYNEISGTTMRFVKNENGYENDYISGKYKNIFFEQADVAIERLDPIDNSTRIEYLGTWMIFDFNKKFKTNIKISPKWFGSKKVLERNTESFKKISVESESFNKKFEIFAQNEHDAFYIITPSLMQRIEKLSVLKDRGFYIYFIYFINNQLHIGCGRNSFEPKGVFKKINETAELSRIYSQIEKITQFIDELNITNDLFVI